MSDVKPQNDRQTGILNAIERIGNAMPDITMLFIYALGGVLGTLLWIIVYQL